MFSMFLYLTLYLQNGLGFRRLQAGVRSSAPLLSFVVAPLAGRMSARVPIRASSGSEGAGRIRPAAHARALGLLRVDGASARLHRRRHRRRARQCALASTAVSVVPPQRAGMGSGINSTFRQVGIATGTARSARSSSTSWSTIVGPAGARARRVPRPGPVPVPGAALTRPTCRFSRAGSTTTCSSRDRGLRRRVLSFVLIRGTTSSSRTPRRRPGRARPPPPRRRARRTQRPLRVVA